MLKIWGRATSSNVQKVLWCCGELGIPFERVDVGGPFGGNQDPEYLALNPNGLVPTVQDGELVLWESNTICRYLATTHRAERLYPVAPAGRALVERWMDWQLSTLGAPMGALLYGLIRSKPEESRPGRDRGGAAQGDRRLDHRRGRARRPALSCRRRAEPGRNRHGNAGLSLARLSARAAAAEKSQIVVRAHARAARLQNPHRNSDHMIVSVPSVWLRRRRGQLNVSCLAKRAMRGGPHMAGENG